MIQKSFFLQFFIFSFLTSLNASIIMQPYLQACTNNSIYIIVECDSTNTVLVKYGTDTNYGNFASTESIAQTTGTNSYIHKIKITNLLSNTLYHYAVSHDGGPWSTDFTFKTAPLEGTIIRFAFAADFRTNTNIHDMVAQHIKESSPDLCLYGGDLCSDGSYDSYKNEWFRNNQLNIISFIPYFNAVGNHEGWGINTQAFHQAPVSNSNSQSYYSFDFGEMHVLVLNNYDPGGYNLGSSQYTFTQNDIQASTKKWKIVISHNPAYCGGGHGEDPVMINMTQNIFEPYGVDIVLSGHSHFYQHNFVNNIHHIIIGSAGAPLYDPVPQTYTVYTMKTYCYGIADLDMCNFYLKVYNEQATPIETITLSKCTATHTPTLTSTFTITSTFTVTPTFTITPTFTPSQTLTILPTTISNFTATIKIYPNPWKRNNSPYNKIVFTGIIPGSEIKIYNLAGTYVFSTKINNDIFEWYAKNESGNDLPAGIYIFYIKSNNEKYKGKIILY